MTISVLLADDNEIVRKAIAGILDTDPEIQVVAEAISFKQTMLFASTYHPQVVVMDVFMDDENEITPSLIKSFLADSCLLAMSFSNEEKMKAIAESYGAVAFLDKTKLTEELIPAIKRCVGGSHQEDKFNH
jgi:two-component system response regulator DevR